MTAYTPKEKVLLVHLVRHNAVIENKKTDIATLMAKHRAWAAIYKIYNSQPYVSTTRTVEQLRKLWNNLKQRKPKGATAPRHNNMPTTGDGPSKKPALERVLQLVEEAAPSLDVSIVCPWSTTALLENEQHKTGRSATEGSMRADNVERTTVENNRPLPSLKPFAPSFSVETPTTTSVRGNRSVAGLTENDARMQKLRLMNRQEEELFNLRKQILEVERGANEIKLRRREAEAELARLKLEDYKKQEMTKHPYFGSRKKNKRSYMRREKKVVNTSDLKYDAGDQFRFTPEQEHEQAIIHDSDVEIENTKPVINGNRIVDLNYVLKWSLSLQVDHSKTCAGGKLNLVKENNFRSGLVSRLTFNCNVCDTTIHKYTEDISEKSKIDYGAVRGTLSSGCTYIHLSDICSFMDIPPMSSQFFQKIEAKLSETWKDSLQEEIKEAGKEERKITLSKGNIDEDGIPFTTVYLNGGWNNHPCGLTNNKASGVATIIGYETNKVLFVAVRNKYCCICSGAANKKEPPQEHLCYRNWYESSSATETDIIVEGFACSTEMHGLRYKRFIADCDDGMHTKIQEKVSYGRCVEKVECSNLCVKSYGKALFRIKMNKAVPLAGRKMLTQNKIKELQTDALKSIRLYTKEALKRGLINNICNVFSDDVNCLKNAGIFHHIQDALDQLIKKSDMIIGDESNDRTKTFMRILAKFECEKGIDSLTQNDCSLEVQRLYVTEEEISSESEIILNRLQLQTMKTEFGIDMKEEIVSAPDEIVQYKTVVKEEFNSDWDGDYLMQTPVNEECEDENVFESEH